MNLITITTDAELDKVLTTPGVTVLFKADCPIADKLAQTPQQSISMTPDPADPNQLWLDHLMFPYRLSTLHDRLTPLLRSLEGGGNIIFEVTPGRDASLRLCLELLASLRSHIDHRGEVVREHDKAFFYERNRSIKTESTSSSDPSAYLNLPTVVGCLADKKEYQWTRLWVLRDSLRDTLGGLAFLGDEVSAVSKRLSDKPFLAGSDLAEEIHPCIDEYRANPPSTPVAKKLSCKRLKRL